MAVSSMSYFADMDRLRSWSRHSNYQTPKSMRGVWNTSYQNSFSGKKLGFQPERIVVDYFTGDRHVMHSQMSRHKQSMKTTLNERARDGFRYWVLDKSKTSQFGKYGTGACKTVLGLGNAPRT